MGSSELKSISPGWTRRWLVGFVGEASSSDEKQGVAILKLSARRPRVHFPKWREDKSDDLSAVDLVGSMPLPTRLGKSN